MDRLGHGNRPLNDSGSQAAEPDKPPMIRTLQSWFGGSSSEATAEPLSSPVSSSNPIQRNVSSAGDERLPNFFPSPDFAKQDTDPSSGSEISAFNASLENNMSRESTGSPTSSDEGYASDVQEVEW